MVYKGELRDRLPVPDVVAFLLNEGNRLRGQDWVEVKGVLSRFLPLSGVRGFRIRIIEPDEALDVGLSHTSFPWILKGPQAQKILEIAENVYRAYGRSHASTVIALGLSEQPVHVEDATLPGYRLLTNLHAALFSKNVLPLAQGGKVDADSAVEPQALFAIAPDGQVLRRDNPYTGAFPVRQYSM